MLSNDNGGGSINCIEQDQDDDLLIDDETSNLTLTEDQEHKLNVSIVYHIILNRFNENLDINDVKMIKIQHFKRYLDELNETFSLSLINRSQLLKELHILHYTGCALDQYFQKHLEPTGVSYKLYRAKIYFPNILYLLIRLLPIARKFIQQSIRKVYNEFQNRSRGLITIHTESLFLDQDVMKTDVLYVFVGNTIKKYDPLTINSLPIFYNTCFRNIFFFYLRRKRYFDQQQIIPFELFNDLIQTGTTTNSNRLSIYKSILYDIHVEKIYKKSPIISQLGYNFQIFRNLIITNEFQAIYQNTKSKSSFTTDNKEFQIVDFYEDDLFETNKDIFDKIKELPMIYKLLKCVHLHTTNIPYNMQTIHMSTVKDVVKEEILYYFKDLFLMGYIEEIAGRIANNFTNNILSGEYINLTTFTTIRISNFTFLDQLRKFIRICLEATCQKN